MAKIAIRVKIAPVYIEVDEDATEDEITAAMEAQGMYTSRPESWEYRDDWRN